MTVGKQLLGVFPLPPIQSVNRMSGAGSVFIICEALMQMDSGDSLNTDIKL